MVQSDWLHYSLSIRQRVAAKQFWRSNDHKFVFTKTIRLLALNFYEAIVNLGFALVNYHLVEKFRARNVIVQHNRVQTPHLQ